MDVVLEGQRKMIIRAFAYLRTGRGLLGYRVSGLRSVYMYYYHDYYYHHHYYYYYYYYLYNYDGYFCFLGRNVTSFSIA